MCMPKAGAIAGRAETSINSINITRKLNQRTKFAKENVLQNLQNVFVSFSGLYPITAPDAFGEENRQN